MQAELIALADRLKIEGRTDDAALVYSAAVALTKPQTPKYEYTRQGWFLLPSAPLLNN